MDHRVLTVFLLLWSSVVPDDVRLVGGDEDTHSSTEVPDDVRLVRGAGPCSGRLEKKHQGLWRPVYDWYFDWNLKSVDAVCRKLNCGSVVSFQRKKDFIPLERPRRNTDPRTWQELEITCSDSVRLVNGTNRCSGRLEVKSNQLWSSVCEDGFDQQDAEVVCRELSCGAPSVLRGALYGGVEAPVWNKEFQCDGHESALPDCDSSDRNTCSSGEAAGLSCSEPGDVRLVGGTSRCGGRLEIKYHDEWRTIKVLNWNLFRAGKVCRQLDCGSAVATRSIKIPDSLTWDQEIDCNASSVTKCGRTPRRFSTFAEITCSDSVRLVDGTNRCSGRLEVKSNQLWSSVCEDGFDQQDAEVVCRELGCGAPSVLRGALYGGVEAPVWTKEFQCDGHESALLDCDSSDRNTCSSVKPVGLICSDPGNIRLVGEASHCAGTLDMKLQREWRPAIDFVDDDRWDQKCAAAVCRQLDCGSAVSTKTTSSSKRPVWWMLPSCLQSVSDLLDCVSVYEDLSISRRREVICSDLLVQPNISSSSTDGVSKAKQQGLQVFMGSSFTITCSIEPQYPGGSFQLIFTAPNTSQSYTLPAVNHSAHFLFSAADHTHQGDYRCVYHVYVFSYNFSSEGQTLVLTVSVSGSLTELIVRHVVGLLGLMSLIVTVVYFHSKASTIQKQGPETNTESNDAVLGGRSPEERVIMSTVLDSRSDEMQ